MTAPSSGSAVSKTCYYELLGVSRKADDSELKTAYRKLALRFHPDKASINGLSGEEATTRFQYLNEAYACLTDPHERAWYDAHREQILYGDDDGGNAGVGGGKDGATDPVEKSLKLFSYFRSSCFGGKFDDSEAGFFVVYEELFRRIDIIEQDYADDESDEEDEAESAKPTRNNRRGAGNRKQEAQKKDKLAPPFGRSTDNSEAFLKKFYSYWQNFQSKRPFGHADQYNPNEAPNRKVRRLIEAENKKARSVARQEYNQKVRQLVAFVMRRDPRVEEQEIAKAKEKRRKLEEKEKQFEEEKERKRIARIAALAEEEKRWEESERLLREQDEREMGILGAASGASASSSKSSPRDGSDYIEGDANDSSPSGPAPTTFVCELCRKTFKSEKQFEVHCKSKKHLLAVEALMGSSSDEESEAAEVVEDETLEDEGAPESESEAKAEGPSAAGAGDKGADSLGADVDVDEKKTSPRSRRSSKSSLSSEDDFLARFASLKTSENRNRGQDEEEQEADLDLNNSVQDEVAQIKGDYVDEEAELPTETGGESSGNGELVEMDVEERKANEVDESDAAARDHLETLERAGHANTEEPAGDDVEVDVGNSVDKGKRRRRRANKTDDAATVSGRTGAAATGGQVAYAPASRVGTGKTSGDSWPEAAGGAPVILACSFCKQAFKTKNKLFEHLKNNPSHMLLKSKSATSANDPAIAGGNKAKRGKNKK